MESFHSAGLFEFFNNNFIPSSFSTRLQNPLMLGIICGEDFILKAVRIFVMETSVK